jgi:hypothetical protein
LSARLEAVRRERDRQRRIDRELKRQRANTLAPTRDSE